MMVGINLFGFRKFELLRGEGEGPGGDGGGAGDAGGTVGFAEAGRGGAPSAAPGASGGLGVSGTAEGGQGQGGGYMSGSQGAISEAAGQGGGQSNEMMSPLGGADAIARQNLVDSFMDTKDGRDLAMFNDSSAYVSPQNQQIAQDNQQTLNLYDDVVDFNTSPLSGNILSNDIEFNEGLVASSDPTQAYLDSLTKPSIQTGANNFIDAVAMQKNDPNQSTTGPFTGFNIVDAANLSAGTVTPNMMPPGYQPTPDEPTFDDLTFDADQISINPLDNISSTLGSPIDPVVGLGTTVDPDLNYSLPVAATPADPNFLDIVGNQGISPTLGQPGSINLDAQMPTGIQDPSGVQDPSFIAGMNQADANIAAPTLSDSYLGQLGIPDFTPTSPQLDESARNEVVDYNTARDIAAQNERNQQSLSNLNLDTSGLGIDASGMTPPQLDEAARGQALADRNALENREASLDYTNTSAPVEGTALSPATIASNQAALDNLDLSTKGLGIDPFDAESRKDLSYEQISKLVDEKLSLQKEIENAPFNPLSLLPGASLLGTSASRRQKAVNQVLSNDGGSGVLGSGIGGSTGVLGTGAVNFNAVYDADGNFVGSQGVTESGETVSYMGDFQGNNGYFDSDGKDISETIDGYQDSIDGGDPEGLDEPYNPCQPGFELDPESGACVPINVVGGGTSSGPINLSSIIRPTTSTTVTPDPVDSGPVSSPTLVTPKQFNMGGATSGSNLDGAIGRLLSSMS